MKSQRAKSSVVKRTTRIGGRKISISLEDHFFEALKEIAKERQSTVQDLVTSIDPDRREPNLSSAIRVFVLEHYQNQIAARTPSP
jgi:predicted DNA-binding ribbon-helix-helix protein